MSKKLEKALKREAAKSDKAEILIGIDRNSYLGQEILKQSNQVIELTKEIIQLRHIVNDLILIIKSKP